MSDETPQTPAQLISLLRQDRQTVEDDGILNQEEKEEYLKDLDK
jgi:hypothetical protein